MCNHLSQACYVVSTTTYLKHKLPVGGILPFQSQMASTWKQLHVMRQNPAWNKVVTTLYTVCLTLYLSLGCGHLTKLLVLSVALYVCMTIP